MNQEQRHILAPDEVETRLLPLLRAGAEVPLVVTGTSMVPFLRDRRDTVYLRTAEGKRLRAGDILFFRREDGTWILHRLYGRKADGRLILNGDGQSWCETIRPDQVAGVVMRIRRGEKPPCTVRRWDWRVLQRVWRLLLPIRPALLRLLGRMH